MNNNNVFLAILWKEWIVFKKRILLILPLIFIIFIILVVGIVFRSKQNAIDPFTMSLVICVYISFLTSLFTMRFGSEKHNGTIEYLFALPLKFRKIILFKLIFSLFVSLAAGLISNILLDILFLFIKVELTVSLFFYQILICFSAIILIIFPVSLINGVALWFFEKKTGFGLQIINYLIILAGVSSILSLNLTGLVNILYVFSAILIILWTAALIIFFSIKKEKAILLIDKK